MIKNYLCWSPQYDHSEEDAAAISTSWDVNDAAEKYVESLHERSDPFETLEVYVKNVDTGLIQVVRVYVDYEPSFSSILTETRNSV